MSTATRPVFGFVPSPGSAASVCEAILTPTDTVRLIVTPNLDHVARLRRSAEFRAAYRDASHVFCDGFPVHAYARLHAHRAGRVTGCDIAERLMADDCPIGPANRLCFVLDADGTADAVAAWASRRGIAGQVATIVPPHGFAGDPDRRRALVAAIAAHRTTLLVMAVGAPRSELFVHRERDALPPCWAICIGQAVKTTLGLVRRAPPIARGIGMEWLWRLAQEPGRLGRRYALGGFDFLLAVTEDMLDEGRAHLREDA